MTKLVSELIIVDLNLAWSPVHQIKAMYVRTEINSRFTGIVPPESKVIQVNFDVSFNGVEGLSVCEIAKELRCARSTVKKYIGLYDLDYLK